jgi:hypothetical protein
LIWAIVYSPELESVCLCSEMGVEKYTDLIASDERNVSAGEGVSDAAFHISHVTFWKPIRLFVAAQRIMKYKEIRSR